MAAKLKTVFVQETEADAAARWGVVADALREKQPGLGALMLETNDEWAVARRYMSLEALARVANTVKFRLPAVAACTEAGSRRGPALLRHVSGHGQSEQDFRDFLAGDHARIAAIEAHMVKYGYRPIGEPPA